MAWLILAGDDVCEGLRYVLVAVRQAGVESASGNALCGQQVYARLQYMTVVKWVLNFF